MSRAIQDAQLVFGFTLDDLEANRRGKLTPYQAARVRQRFWRKFFWGNFIPITVGVLLLTYAIGNFVGGGTADASLFVLAGAGFMALCLSGVALIDWLPYRKDFRAGKVLQTKGKAEPDRVASRFRAAYVFLGTDIVLPLSVQELQAFTEGKTYTVYYLPNTRVILSVDDR